MQLVGDGDEPPVDGDGRGLLIEVVPAQPEQLIAAHAGERRHPQRGEEPVAGGGSQERLQLLGGPGLLLDLGDGPEPGGVGDQRDIAGDEATACGVFESAADDEVDLVHRLRRERGAAVARVQEPLVERLEMMRAQPPQADPTERRDDVVLDVAAVPVEVVAASTTRLPGSQRAVR